MINRLASRIAAAHIKLQTFSSAAGACLLAFAVSANAGMVDKAKALKENIDKAANQPVKVDIGKSSLLENRDDILKVFAAFKKKIGADPMMVYGARIDWKNQVTVTYQSRFNKEKLETLYFSKNEIQGKPAPFKLIGNNVKVADNVFDLGKVKMDAIPGLVKTAREKTSEATKGKKTLGTTVNIVQYWTSGQPTQVRIVVNVAADDKSAGELIGNALVSLKDDTVAKGSSVGQLIADESGNVLGFRLK